MCGRFALKNPLALKAAFGLNEMPERKYGPGKPACNSPAKLQPAIRSRFHPAAETASLPVQHVPQPAGVLH
jgi:hypothetical protein